MKKNNVIYKSIVFALITAFVSGFSIFYAKITVTKIDPIVLTTSRNLFVGFLFLILCIKNNSFRVIGRMNKAQLIKLVSVGIVGGAIPFYLFFTGLQYTSAIAANMIHKTLFFWAGILSILILKEKPRISYFLVAFLILFFQIILSGSVFYFGKGELMIIAATLLWSSEQIISKKILQDVSPSVIGLFRMGIGGLVLLYISLMSGKGGSFIGLNQSQLLFIFIGSILLFFYVFFWYKALHIGSVSLVTIILTLSTVTGTLLNGSFAHVNITSNEIYLSILIVASLFFLLIQKKYHSNALASKINK